MQKTNNWKPKKTYKIVPFFKAWKILEKKKKNQLLGKKLLGKLQLFNSNSFECKLSSSSAVLNVIGKVFCVNIDIWSDTGKPESQRYLSGIYHEALWQAEQYSSSCDDVSLCGPWVFTGCILQIQFWKRYSSKIFFKMKVFLLFDGFSKVSFFSAAGIKPVLPWWSIPWWCWFTSCI